MYRRLDRISLMLEELGLQHEKNRQMMLRRLCGCRDVAALEVLLGTIEPVKIYRRGRLRRYTSFSPLTRTVDVAWPDAGPARRFRWAVDRLVAADFEDPPELEVARNWLRRWQDNHAALLHTIQTSPAPWTATWIVASGASWLTAKRNGRSCHASVGAGSFCSASVALPLLSRTTKPLGALPRAHTEPA